MEFTLLFTIGLSVVLLLGAFFICKSDLPTNDKIISIIAILALFSLVSIINEAKKTPKETIIHNVPEFYKSFLTSSDASSSHLIPTLEGNKDFVIRSLGGFDAELSSGRQSGGYLFAFVFSNHKVGKTSAFKEYAKELHKKDIPALYLDIENPSTDVAQIVKRLKIPSLNTLDDFVDKQNREDKVPNIFVDNINNAFITHEKNTKEVPCPLCEYFKSLFDNKRVNIIFISNRGDIRDLLRSTESYNRRLSFFEVDERNPGEVDASWLESINQNIRKDEKKFSQDSFKSFIKFFGWNFNALTDYVTNIDAYEGVKGFIDKFNHQESQRITSQESITDLIRTLVLLTREKNENYWMSYGLIKKNFGRDPSSKLDDAVQADILVTNGNLYRFKNQATYQSALISEGFKVTE